MNPLADVSLKARNFKCFADPEQGFDAIKSINLVIGRNNSGKSSLLDLIEHAVLGTKNIPRELWRLPNQAPEIIFGCNLEATELKQIFSPSNTAGGIPGRHHWEFGQRLIGARMTYQAFPKPKFIAISESPNWEKPLDGVREEVKTTFEKALSERKGNPLAGKQFRRIYAERDIVPEIDNPGNLSVSGNGRGATNILQNFINKARLPRDLVEETLLAELNEIFLTDAQFTDIVCQQLEDNRWEIYLQEDIKGLIPLSQSGSGLKTVILVLVFLHLLPEVEKHDLSEFIFGFEELENNLHPALLRRLMTYLHAKSSKHGCQFFLTTHSNVEIDFFSRSEDAQIVHVTHDGKAASVRTAKTYIENRGVLDDLDIRASDLLQSNGIIWVEGPSDRIYLNKWINVWSNGSLVEGTHYQCVFYGGRLLSHLSCDEPDVIEETLSILRVNRNAIVIIDSDKRTQQTPLNATKKRIQGEAEKAGVDVWITKGREIENYIPASAITCWLELPREEQVEQYADFFDYLDGIKAEEGKRYRKQKALLAEQVAVHMTKDNLDVLDLKERLDQVCSAIRRWNT
jgi:hypothetical protein